MAAKYFVWGEGVWRELDVASGRVSGWRRPARFMFVRRGRLLVARRRPVLHALEELAVGQLSAATDGPRLSYLSKPENRTKRKNETPAVSAVPPVPVVTPTPPMPAEPPVAPPACHHHCCAHRYNNNDERPAGKHSKATQCAPSVAGPSALIFNVKQKDNTTATAITAPDCSSADEFMTKNTRRPSLAARRTTEVKKLFGKTPATEPTVTAADKTRTPGTSHPADKAGDDRRERARKRPRTIVSDSTSVDEPLQRSAMTDRQTLSACKELIITDEDVALLRGYVSRTNASALQRFDADDAYKRLLFYAINPLVHLERCARLECLLRTHSLGLVPTRPRARPAPRTERSERGERNASADTDKENKNKHSSPNKVREPVSATKKSPEEKPAAGESAPPVRAIPSRLGVAKRSNKLEIEEAAIKAPETNSVARDPPRAKPERSKKQADIARGAGASTAAVPPGTHVISKRATQRFAKEYSNLEDHAIVAWLGGGSRACLVSGNRVWRDLQEQYERLTGRARSWHSLRNRYLRYILPSLGALQLPPADVSRLRAAAATGTYTYNRYLRYILPSPTCRACALPPPPVRIRTTATCATSCRRRRVAPARCRRHRYVYVQPLPALHPAVADVSRLRAAAATGTYTYNRYLRYILPSPTCRACALPPPPVRIRTTATCATSCRRRRVAPARCRRHRYVYVQPLPALHPAVADVSRLRAAAATGTYTYNRYLRYILPSPTCRACALPPPPALSRQRIAWRRGATPRSRRRSAAHSRGARETREARQTRQTREAAPPATTQIPPVMMILTVRPRRSVARCGLVHQNTPAKKPAIRTRAATSRQGRHLAVRSSIVRHPTAKSLKRAAILRSTVRHLAVRSLVVKRAAVRSTVRHLAVKSPPASSQVVKRPVVRLVGRLARRATRK